MAKIRSTSNGAYEKYSTKLEQILLSSMLYLKPIVFNNKQYIIKSNEANRNAITEYVSTIPYDPDFALNKILLETDSGVNINFGSLEKPKLQKVPNKGVVAEAILATALYTRFETGYDITLPDIYNTVSSFHPCNKGNVSLIAEYGLKISLPHIHMHTFMDSSLWFNELKGISDSSCMLANSKYIQDQIHDDSLITIHADGVGGSSSTKTDITIIEDALPIISISLKTGGVKQFGQVGGNSFLSLSRMWRLLGIDTSSLYTQYYDLLLHHKDITSAFRLIYNYINSVQIEDEYLINFILHYATMNESDVILINLGEAEFDVYEFDNLSRLIGTRITSYIKYGIGNKPTLVISSDSKPIISIRMKIENKTKGVYARTYIEAEKGLFDLLRVKT